jgi:hypothetical protein
MIEVSAGGALEVPQQKAAVGSVTKRSFMAELKSGESVSFTMSPARSEIRISGTIDGRPLRPSDILYGSSAVAINTSLVIKPEDRPYCKGFPASFKEDKAPVLLFGISTKDKVASEDLKNSPKQLKSMLEQWGYIN